MQKKRILSLFLAIVFCVSLMPTVSLTALADEPDPDDGAVTTEAATTEAVTTEDAAIPIYVDPSYSFAERAADLVARMTLAQKGSQMISNSASAIAAGDLGGGALNVPATIGISSYTWWQEALHGYSLGNCTNSVSYPQNIAVGSTWNPDLYYQEAGMIGDEIRERASTVSSGVNKGNAINLTVYSPDVNIQRDPRWGRNEESYSEDPFLQSAMGTQFILGMQGKDQDGNVIDENGYIKVNPTLKHYTANNGENYRLNSGATMDLRTLREYYTASFRNIIENTDVSSVMTAYSTVNGEPCSISSYLMETLLRQTWGFSGYVTGDCDSVASIARHNYVNPHTGKVLTTIEQFSQALAHGEDLECSGGYDSNASGYSYKAYATSMVESAVETDKGVFTENQIDVSLARLMTARMQTGEFDDSSTVSYTTEAAARIADQKTTSPATAIYWQTADRLQTVEDVASEAVVMLKNDVPSIEGATAKILPLQIPTEGAYNVAIVGSWQTNMYLGLYSAGQSNSANQINIQNGIKNAILAKDPDATFTLITSNSLTEANETAIAAADAVIVVVGTSDSYSKEDKDRSSIALPDNLGTFISTVGKLNPKTIAVMETCGAMQVTEFKDDVAAILWSSYEGLRKVGFGNVIAGAVNPSGKLTSTWYQSSSDIPDMTNYNIYNTNGDSGRTYMYYNGTNPVSYPFGYGLSYTTFAYSNLKILKGDAATTEFGANDTITVQFDVTNTGTVAGKEVAELYVAQPGADPTLNRPIRRLEGFDKIALDPEETKTVTLEVAIPDLAFYNELGDRYIVDTGAYQIQVGTSSASANLTGDISVTGELNIVPAVLTAKPNQTGDDAKGIEERLIFDAGKTVNPQLTLAMNDESLYGYIIKNQLSPIKQKSSTAFLEGTEFSYVSNRPSVVSVAEDGTITTVAPGVATITATATYNGVSASTDFVVYVESTQYLDDITIKVGDGETASVPGFAKDTYNYAVEVPTDVTDISSIVVTPVYTNPNLTVNVTPATGIPGVYTITTENSYNGLAATYRVGVGYAPVATDFKEGETATLAKGWTVLNGNTNTNAVFGANGLTITSEKGAFTSETDQPKNVYMLSAFGNWVAQTKVSLDVTPSASNQQAGLILYDQNSDYIRFVYERPTSGTSNVLRVYKVVGGTQTQVNSATLASLTSIYLQIIKDEDVYTFKYSTDGVTWTQFSTTVTADYACPLIGLWANNGDTDAASISATYEKLSIFTVAALQPRLSSISIDGSPLGGFDADTFVYNVEVGEDAVDAPVITAEADPMYTVSYTQPSGPVGTGTVTVSTEAASIDYKLYFNYNPISDYFADGDMSSRWEVLREDTSAYSIDKGYGLRLPTQRYDIYSTGAAWKNCFVQPGMGNWEVVEKVFYPSKPTTNYQQAMLLVWQDENNYIRMNCQQSTLKYEPGKETNGSMSNSGFTTSKTGSASTDGTVTNYFKITKEGNTYSVAYSQDGLNYTNLGSTTADYENPRIGLFATQNSSGTALNTYAEYIYVTSLNGVPNTIDYSVMLQDAVDHVEGYIVDGITATAKSNIDLTAPHGYTVTLTSSDTDAISSEGVVSYGEEEKTVELTVSVTDGTREKTSDVINVTVPAASNFGAPTNFTAVGGIGQASLAWTAVDGATDYNIYMSDTEGTLGDLVQTVAAPAVSCTITDLEEDTYYFTVKAADFTGEGAASEQRSALVLTIPVAPVLAAADGDGEATLTWNTISNAKSYKIYASQTSGEAGDLIADPEIVIDEGTATCVIDSLKGGTYYFTVKACNDAGDSNPSNEKEATLHVNMVELTAARSVIIDDDNDEVTFHVSADKLQDAWVIQGNIALSNEAFSIENITLCDTSSGILLTTDIDGADAYFILAKVGGFTDVDQIDLIDITVKLNAGAEVPGSLTGALESLDVYFGNVDTYEAEKVYSEIKNSGTAAVSLYTPSDVYGDFDGNNGLDGNDLAFVLACFGMKESDADWYSSGAWRADMDGNGEINVIDVTMHAYMVAHFVAL